MHGLYNSVKTLALWLKLLQKLQSTEKFIYIQGLRLKF